jgi:hypothetical protein
MRRNQGRLGKCVRKGFVQRLKFIRAHYLPLRPGAPSRRLILPRIPAGD